MSADIIARIQVGNYDIWRPMFDQDKPRAREKATGQRVFRRVDDPDHVFIFLEFDSLEDAHEAERRLLDSARSTGSTTCTGRTSLWRRLGAALRSRGRIGLQGPTWYSSVTWSASQPFSVAAAPVAAAPVAAAEVPTVELTGMGLVMRFGAGGRRVNVRGPIGHRDICSFVTEAAASYDSYSIGEK